MKPAPHRQPASRLAVRLERAEPVVLDGATGTQLEARGVRSELPLWSAHALLVAPEQVRAIHADYASAGAEIVTANTFRTQARTLARAGLADRARELTALAVRLAREGAGDALVAGSDPPLEDCFEPERAPNDAALRAEHREHIDHLARAGVDLVLVETMNNVREAVAAAGAAAEASLPFAVSFTCSGEARLLSGEPLAEAVRAVAGFGPTATLVNCLPPSAIPPCLAVLRETTETFGLYPNLGAPGALPGDAHSEACTPGAFAEQARVWIEAGARLVGGCCGTTPAHIRALREAIAHS